MSGKDETLIRLRDNMTQAEFVAVIDDVNRINQRLLQISISCC